MKSLKIALLWVIVALFYLFGPIALYPVFDVLLSNGHDMLAVADAWGWKLGASVYYTMCFVATSLFMVMMGKMGCFKRS